MADSGVINPGHEPNSVQSLLQCPFERRTLAEKLKVKELGPDQPDGLINCEELFVKLFAASGPHLKNNSPAATAVGSFFQCLGSLCTFYFISKIVSVQYIVQMYAEQHTGADLGKVGFIFAQSQHSHISAFNSFVNLHQKRLISVSYHYRLL